MKKKTLIVVLVVLMIGLIIVFFVANGKKKVQSSVVEETENELIQNNTETLETESKKNDETKKTDVESATESESETETESDTQSGEPSGGNGEGTVFWDDSAATDEAQTEAEVGDGDTGETEGPAIPGDVGETGLYVEKLGGYNGVYVEDGSDDTVSNVSTILLKNNTGKIVQYAQLTFKVSSGGEAVFSFSNLPTGAEIMVFEQNKQAYNSGAVYTLLDQTIAYMDNMSMMEDKVGIVTQSDNTITITNKTNNDMPSLRLFYKYRYNNGTYVGGITFTAKIENLKAGESTTVSPSHFDAGGSEIVMVAQYNE